MISALRVMACAYLSNDSAILMLHRSPTRRLMPNLWAPVGGHVEHGEFSDLEAACLREIREESGIGPDQIADLELRYIVLRQRADELRQQFVYFGRTTTRDVVDSDEGTLHWVPVGELLDLPMSQSNHFLLQHYLTQPPTGTALVGVVRDEGTAPAISWSTLSDWEI